MIFLISSTFINCVKRSTLQHITAFPFWVVTKIYEISKRESLISYIT